MHAVIDKIYQTSILYIKFSLFRSYQKKYWMKMTQQDIYQFLPILQTMTIIRLILTVAVIIAINCITFPVNSLKDRCMVVYTQSEEDYLKIDIKFQRFYGQALDEGYRVTLINTENQQQELYNIEDGTFRKELKLTPNVIYQLCIRIILSRSDHGQIQQPIQYNSGVRHNANLDSSNIQIPPNLVNIKDLKQSYSHLTYMQRMQEMVTDSIKKQKQTEDQIFNDQSAEIKKLQWLSFVELAVICIFGGYQFVRLRRIIDNKQNN